MIPQKRLTLEEGSLRREVEAVVDELRPLLAQVVAEGADTAVKDTVLKSARAVFIAFLEVTLTVPRWQDEQCGAKSCRASRLQ